MADASTVDSPNALSALNAALGAFDPATRHRGSQYHRAGRVVRQARAGAYTVDADVIGTRLYHVQLARAGGFWSGTCTCPLGGQCKHVFAAALAWKEFLTTGQKPGSSESTHGAPATFRQKWEPILAAKLGRDLRREEGAFLDLVAHLYARLQVNGRIFAQELGSLGFATNEARRGPFHAAYEGWWTTPPRDPLELWQYIAHDIESSKLRVPDFLIPVTDTGPVRAWLEGRQRRQAVERWTERLSQLGFRAGAAAEPVVTDPTHLEVRLRVSPSEWALESRPGAEQPWRTVTRQMADRLSQPETGLIATLETTPAGYAFLAVWQEHRRTFHSFDLRREGYGARELLHKLLRHRLARTLVVDSAGQPIEFAPAPLAWRLTRGEGDPGDYQLALELPDGSPLPASATHLPGNPELYLHGKHVYRGPPPLDGNSVAAALIPREAIDQPATLRMLRQLGTRMPPDIEARFVTVPQRARVECRLQENAYSGGEFLSIQLTATSENGRVTQRWTDHGWEAESDLGGEGPDASGPIQSPDLTGPQRVADSLVGLRMAYERYQAHWLRRLTKALPEEFLAWRESLPADVEVLATGELASLLGAPVKASVDFSLLESEVHRDWFDLALVLKPEDATLTPDELSLLLRARGKLVRIPGKGWRRLQVQIDDAAAATLESAGLERATLAEAALAGERHRFHALQLTQSGLADQLPERQAEMLRSRARAIAVPEPPPIPEGLRAELRPYQRDGFHFLAFLSLNGLGGVLADDMGLGKTVQTLAWLLWLAGRKPAGAPFRALVICPKSVMGIWQGEAAKFAPSLEVVRFVPGAPEPARETAGPVIVVANYSQLRINAAHFSAQRWDAVILDEGQFIKTPSSKVAQVARELPGEHRLVLTGTPIENRLLDLWSLFAFALPGLLGSQASFKRHYSAENPLALPRLRARVRHFLLRRTKGQVAADLPPRIEEDVTVDLEGEQARLYQAELKRARAQLLKIDTTRELDKVRFNILASLLRLRQICCHPALIDPSLHAAPSAKLDELMDRLEELRDEGHQVLVFSQFVSMLELIQERVVKAGIRHLLLTGQTEDREELVGQFQADKEITVFLLSLKAAGFGLNLTAASYVVLYDPWWNPAVEAQAIDRTHRIGQAVPVNAYRLIARGTIEEKIRLLQREKATLAGAIVQEESLASVLDLDSLREILS